MTGLIMAAQLIMGLSLLIILHELGHFLAARMFGIRVEKFFLFFDAWGFKLFHIKTKRTEYGIGWLPFGGYVKIAGMIDESMDKEAMKQPPQPWEFRSKPAWQRLIVMVAGVFMNLVLGSLIFAFVTFHYEKDYLPNSNVTSGIYAYETARNIGFKTGDKILAVDGKKIERFKDAMSINVLLGATITVNRNGKTRDIQVPEDFYKTYKSNNRDFFIEAHNLPAAIDSVIPEMTASKCGLKKGDKILMIDTVNVTCYGKFREEIWKHKGKLIALQLLRNNDTMQIKMQIDTTGLIGIFCKVPYELKHYTFLSALTYGTGDAMNNLWANIRGMGRIFSGKENARESLQGPIGIAHIYGGKWDWFRFWSITGLLSMILAFMNILPIPALDGGHVIFTAIEMITRRKFSDKFMEKVQMVGMFIILAIMVLVIFNDILKLF
jgi:regulator of sigma E protease